MDSRIIDGFIGLCSLIYGYIEKSRAYDIFMKIYLWVGRMWKESGIISLLRRSGGKTKSFLYGVMRIPITILEAIGEKIAPFLRKSIKNSAAARLCGSILANVLYLNTRFIGSFIAVCGTVTAVMYFISSDGFSRGTIAFAGLAVFGFILTAFSVNLSEYFEKSITFGFLAYIKKALKLDNAYKAEETGGAWALAAGVILGAVSAAAGHINILFIPASAIAVVFMLAVLKAPFVGAVAAVLAGPFVPTMALAGLCIYTTAAFVIKAVCTPGYKWRFGAVGCGIQLLMLILLATSILSCSMKTSLTVWAMYFVFMTFFFTVLNAAETTDDVKTIISAFVIAALGVSIYGIMQYVFGWTTENAWIDENMFGESMRVYSTLGNPNVLGEYLLLALPLSAALAVYTDRKYISKWFYMASFVVLAFCLVLTQSRGCWLGFILAGVIFVSFWNGKVWGLALLGICILPWILPESIISRVASIGNMGDSSTSYRVFIWLGTLDMLKDYWIGGIGMGEGAFAMVYPKYSYSAIVAPHSHNVFLQLAVEGGISTLIIFLAVMFVFLRQMYEVYHVTEKKSFGQLAALGSGSGMAAFLLQSMFDYTFYNYRVMGLFFMYMAIGTALYMICVKSKVYPGERDEQTSVQKGRIK